MDRYKRIANISYRTDDGFKGVYTRSDYEREVAWIRRSDAVKAYDADSDDSAVMSGAEFTESYGDTPWSLEFIPTLRVRDGLGRVVDVRWRRNGEPVKFAGPLPLCELGVEASVRPAQDPARPGRTVLARHTLSVDDVEAFVRMQWHALRGVGDYADMGQMYEYGLEIETVR